MRLFRLRRTCIWLLGASFLTCMVIGIYFITKDETSASLKQPKISWLDSEISQDENRFAVGGSQLIQKIKPRSDRINANGDYDINQNIHENIQQPVFMEKPKNLQQGKIIHFSNEQNKTKAQNNSHLIGLPVPNYNVHVFYYVWYGNLKVDGEYMHWNHPRLPHWDKRIAQKYSLSDHVPPDDIGANFYPELGPYSSRDPEVIENHMRQIRISGAGVLAVSWYPPGLADDNGRTWDDLMPTILDKAQRYQLKVCFHIEPFVGRTASTVQQWISYIVQTYSSHPAFYRYQWRGRELPLYYLYDSYQVPKSEWQQLFSPTGAKTLRNTPLDGHFIGLIVEKSHQSALIEAGFDGYYTYFASNGFSYGSTYVNWINLSSEARKHEKIFIPSVGPGYIDDRVRPWNKQNTKKRKDGHYYEESFLSAIGCSAPLISVTSFNEWHEGTQIERAVPHTDKEFKYLDYSPYGADYYLKLTKKWVDKFAEHVRRIR